jgi:hypothetical protein
MLGAASRLWSVREFLVLQAKPGDTLSILGLANLEAERLLDLRQTMCREGVDMLAATEWAAAIATTRPWSQDQFEEHWGSQLRLLRHEHADLLLSAELSAGTGRDEWRERARIVEHRIDRVESWRRETTEKAGAFWAGWNRIAAGRPEPLELSPEHFGRLMPKV